jgi:hypothetical protein
VIGSVVENKEQASGSAEEVVVCSCGCAEEGFEEVVSLAWDL